MRRSGSSNQKEGIEMSIEQIVREILKAVKANVNLFQYL